MDPASTPEELLQHAGWLRALARSLVRDPATADDLVQETLSAAVDHPPRKDTLRAWLGKVLRNAAAQRFRADSRRLRRERTSARNEELPSSAELASRMELQRKLVECVQELAEPYRSTVVLRYYEGLTAAEIARKKGLPGATVRSHLKRGLDELRRSLDRRHGGSRDVWSAILLPWLDLKPETALATATALTSGVLTMSTGMKLGLAASVLTVAVVGYGVVKQDAEQLEPAEMAAEVAHAAETTPPVKAPDAKATTLAERTVLETPTTAAAPKAAAESAYAVTAQVVDRTLSPVAGATVWVEGAELELPPSDSEGRLALAFDLPEFDATRRVRVSRTGFATFETTAKFRRGVTTDLGQVVLDPGGSIRGRVVDPDGLPVSDARLQATEADLLSVDVELARRSGPGAWQPQLPAYSDTDGSFVLAGRPVGYHTVWAQGEGTLWTVSEPVEVRAGEETAGLVLELTPAEPADVLAGVVLDPAGKPVPNCFVSCTLENSLTYLPRFLSTDAEGRFRFLIARDELYDIRARDPQQRWTDVALADAGFDTELVLRFAETRWLELEVVDSAGEQAPGVRALAIVSSERSSRSVSSGEETETPGVFRLREPRETFTLRVGADGCAEQTLGPFAPGSVAGRLRVELQGVPGIRGRVLAAGEPVAGAQVDLFLLPLETRDQHEVIYYAGFPLDRSPWAEGTVSSDAEGRFAFTAADVRGYVVRAEHAGHAPSEVRLHRFDPSAGAPDIELELFAGGAIEGEVVPPVDGVAAGTLVAISRGDGRHRVQRVGDDGHFLFEHLTPGRWNVEVLERQLEENPSSTHSIVDEPFELPWVCQVREGEVTFYDVDLRRIPACTVAGEVIVDGAPAESWLVRLDAPSRLGSRDVPQTMVGADGSFELATPDEGEYTLSLVTATGAGRFVLQETLELRHGRLEWALDLVTAPVVIENLPAGELSFVVWEGRDGLACRMPLEPEEDGSVSLPRFPAGEIRVTTGPVRPRQWDTMMTLARAMSVAGKTIRIAVP